MTLLSRLKATAKAIAKTMKPARYIVGNSNSNGNTKRYTVRQNMNTNLNRHEPRTHKMDVSNQSITGLTGHHVRIVQPVPMESFTIRGLKTAAAPLRELVRIPGAITQKVVQGVSYIPRKGVGIFAPKFVRNTEAKSKSFSKSFTKGLNSALSIYKIRAKKPNTGGGKRTRKNGLQKYH